MQRIISALQRNRCVLVCGEQVVNSDNAKTIETEIAKKNLPVVSMTNTSSSVIPGFSKEALTPALQSEGLVVLVGPSFSEEHMETVATILSEQNPRPQVYIVAKFYNQFSMPATMRSWKMTQVKNNAVPFFKELPVVETVVEAPKHTHQPKTARKLEFMGREAEMANLQTLCATKGKPIALVGAQGVGKRSLVSAVCQNTKQIPTLHIDENYGVDALLARLAETFAECGDNALLTGLSGKNRINVEQTIQLLSQGLANPQLADYSFTISGVESLISKGKFENVGLLELVIDTMWNTESALQCVFLFHKLPPTAQKLRVVEIQGLSLDNSKSFLEMWQAPSITDADMTKMYAITEGHPMLLRFYAMRANQETTENPYAFLEKIQSKETVSRLRKTLQKKLESLNKEEKEALLILHTSSQALSANQITEMNIHKDTRRSLLQHGLLEQTLYSSERKYYVHALTIKELGNDTLLDFAVLEQLGDALLAKSKSFNAKFAKENANSLQETVTIFEGNTLLWMARKRKKMWNTRLPCTDFIVSSAKTLMAKPNTDKTDFTHIAELQIKDALQKSADHPELLFVQAELAQKDKSRRGQLVEIYQQLHNKALLPKVLLAESAVLLEKGMVDKAIKVLHIATTTYPSIEDIWYQQARLLVEQNQIAKGLQTIDKAIELHNSTPSYHSLRGEILMHMGTAHWTDAQQSLATAKTLYNNKIPTEHLLREVNMLQLQSMIDVDNKKAILLEALSTLDKGLAHDDKNPKLQVALAGVLLDVESTDYDKISKLLKPSIKSRKNADAFINKAKLLIRQNALTDVESCLDIAFKLSQNKQKINNVRGEYYLAKDELTMALNAFTAAMNASPKDGPEYHSNKLRVEQITMILASNASRDYSSVGEDNVDISMPAESTNSSVLVRKKK